MGNCVLAKCITDKMEKTDKPQGIQLNFFLMYDGLRHWLTFLLRKWWIICLVAFVGGILGILYAYLQKPKYQSRLTFALEENDAGLGGALGLAAEFGFSIGGSKNIFEGDNILSLLTSRRIVERVLLSPDTVNGKPMTMIEFYRLTKTDTTKETKKLTAAQQRLQSVHYPVNMSRAAFSYLQDSVLLNTYKEFAEDGLLAVSKPDKKLNLYEVSITSLNEKFSKDFTDKLIAEATAFYIELKTQKSRQTLNVLEERVANIKGSLNSAIAGRATLQDANVNTAYQQAQARLQEKQVDITAYGGAYGELFKNLELARYQYLKDIPLLQIIDGADYPMKKIKKGRLLTGLIVAFLFGAATVVFLIVKQLFRSQRLLVPANNSFQQNVLPVE